MSCHRVTFLAGLSIAILGVRGLAEDPPETPNPAVAPRLKEVLHDDFQTDTRQNYDIKGDVAWDKGKLTLSKVTNAILGSPQTENDRIRINDRPSA